MTLSVLALWSCIALEQVALNRAARDARACVRALQHLQERAIPASEPVPFHRQTAKLS